MCVRRSQVFSDLPFLRHLKTHGGEEGSTRKCDLCQVRTFALEKDNNATQVPFQQRATLESHRRRCTGKQPPRSSSATISTTGVGNLGISASSPKSSPDESTNPAIALPFSLESNSATPQTIILPNLNVVSPIPKKLPNLHSNNHLANNPKSSPTGPTVSPKSSAQAECLGEGKKSETTKSAKNPMHFLGFKYLASSKLLNSGQTMDSSDLTLPKAELC